MRVGRQKKVNRDLRRYKMIFGMQEPYRVLMDPTFVHVALESKIQIKEQMENLLCTNKLTPMVTNCGIAELRGLVEKLGNQYKGALTIAKGFYRVKCGCKTAKSARSCIERCFRVASQAGEGGANALQVANDSGAEGKSSASSSSKDAGKSSSKRGDDGDASEGELSEEEDGEAGKAPTSSSRTGEEERAAKKSAGGGSASSSSSSKQNGGGGGSGAVEAEPELKNTRKWLVASQDDQLKKFLRKIPGVPLISLAGQVPRLEPFSQASSRYQSDVSDGKLRHSLGWEEKKALPVLKREKELKEAMQGVEVRKKRKGPKSANPLSCLKKKTKSAPGSGAGSHPKQQVAKSDEAPRTRKKKTRSRRGKESAVPTAPA